MSSMTHDMFILSYLKGTCRYLSLTPCGVGKLFVIFMRRGHIRNTAGCLLISTINQVLQIFWKSWNITHCISLFSNPYSLTVKCVKDKKYCLSFVGARCTSIHFLKNYDISTLNYYGPYVIRYFFFGW